MKEKSCPVGSRDCCSHTGLPGSTRLPYPACQCLLLSPPLTAMTRPEMQQLSHQMTAVHRGHFSALAHSEGQPQVHLTRLLTPPQQICTAAAGDGSVANCSEQ